MESRGKARCVEFGRKVGVKRFRGVMRSKKGRSVKVWCGEGVKGGV